MNILRRRRRRIRRHMLIACPRCGGPKTADRPYCSAACQRAAYHDADVEDYRQDLDDLRYELSLVADYVGKVRDRHEKLPEAQQLDWFSIQLQLSACKQLLDNACSTKESP